MIFCLRFPEPTDALRWLHLLVRTYYDIVQLPFPPSFLHLKAPRCNATGYPPLFGIAIDVPVRVVGKFADVRKRLLAEASDDIFAPCTLSELFRAMPPSCRVMAFVPESHHYGPRGLLPSFQRDLGDLFADGAPLPPADPDMPDLEIPPLPPLLIRQNAMDFSDSFESSFERPHGPFSDDDQNPILHSLPPDFADSSPFYGRDCSFCMHPLAYCMCLSPTFQPEE